MELNNLPSNPAQITKELVRASFNMETTRLNYQAILQSIEDIVWTRENIDQPLLEPGKFVATKLTEKKDKDKRPLIDAGKIIQTGYNDFFNPLNDAISRKTSERKRLADIMQEEDDVAAREVERLNKINTAIRDFINLMTNEISKADNDKTIVALEMRIGSESIRKNIYQEHLPDLKAQCDEMKPLIKKQKEYIRTLAEIAKNQAEALKKGNDDKAVELREKAEEMQAVIEENKIRLQQKAYEQVENSGVIVGEPVLVAPKASRTMWKWRVDDMQALYKKMPELVELVPNKEKIDEILKRKREDGSLDGKREEKMSGITFYEDKSYR